MAKDERLAAEFLPGDYVEYERESGPTDPAAWGYQQAVRARGTVRKVAQFTDGTPCLEIRELMPSPASVSMRPRNVRRVTVTVPRETYDADRILSLERAPDRVLPGGRVLNLRDMVMRVYDSFGPVHHDPPLMLDRLPAERPSAQRDRLLREHQRLRRHARSLRRGGSAARAVARRMDELERAIAAFDASQD